jgi:hypothetical protein
MLKTIVYFQTLCKRLPSWITFEKKFDTKMFQDRKKSYSILLKHYIILNKILDSIIQSLKRIFTDLWKVSFILPIILSEKNKLDFEKSILRSLFGLLLHMDLHKRKVL